MSTTGHTRRANAGALVLAAALSLGTASVVPAHSAVVAAAPSATTTSVELKPTTVAYGEAAKAVVTVDTATNGGPKPTGKVELEVGDQTVLADVTNSGRVELDVPLLDASTTPYAVTAAFAPADPLAFSASSAPPASVTVTKDATTSAATALRKVSKRRIIAKSFVTSTNGQVPTGKVTFILRRNGRKIDASVVSLNGNTDPTRNLARTRFDGVPKTGTYKVVAKYRGSTNFLPSKASYSLPR